MYINPAFRQDDSEVLAGFVNDHPFATLILSQNDVPVASHLPLLLERNETGHWILEGHLARNNGMSAADFNGAQALAIFHGPNQYISSRWYPSTQETGLGVPTWNYQTVHCHGRIELIDGRTSEDTHGWVYGHMRRLTERMEQRLPDAETPPWQMDQAPPEHIEALMRGVVGLRLAVERIEGSYKLSQNKSQSDRSAVLAKLDRQDSDDARGIAEAMRQFAPD